MHKPTSLVQIHAEHNLESTQTKTTNQPYILQNVAFTYILSPNNLSSISAY